MISVFAGVVAHYLLTVGDEGRTDENEWMGGWTVGTDGPDTGNLTD